jgi:uncharacterized protein YceK
MNKHILKLFLVIFVLSITFSGCSHTVYVTQQQQSFHDHKAMKHDKIVNKTKKPKVKRY